MIFSENVYAFFNKETRMTGNSTKHCSRRVCEEQQKQQEVVKAGLLDGDAVELEVSDLKSTIF